MLVTTHYHTASKQVVFTFTWCLTTTHTERKEFIKALPREFKDMLVVEDSTAGNTRLVLPCGTDNLYKLKYYGEDRKALVKSFGRTYSM